MFNLFCIFFLKVPSVPSSRRLAQTLKDLHVPPQSLPNKELPFSLDVKEDNLQRLRRPLGQNRAATRVIMDLCRGASSFSQKRVMEMDEVQICCP